MRATAAIMAKAKGVRSKCVDITLVLGVKKNASEFRVLLKVSLINKKNESVNKCFK